MSFKISVTTLSGRTIVVEVDVGTIIRNVKKAIQEALAIPWFEQKLLNGTQQLDNNDKTLYAYNVYLDGVFSVIHMDFGERLDVVFTVFWWPHQNDNKEFMESLGRYMPAAVIVEVLQQHAPWALAAQIIYTMDVTLEGYTCLDDFIRDNETEFLLEFEAAGNKLMFSIEPDPALYSDDSNNESVSDDEPIIDDP